STAEPFGVAVPHPCGSQYLRLGVAYIECFQRARRGHRRKRQDLQQVALDHVTQGTRHVVETGAALQAECFVEHDLDRVDVFGGEQGFDHPVGEPDTEDVQYRRHAEEVVDAVYALLGDQPVQQLDQRHGACPVGTERLVQYQARTVWHTDPGQGPAAFDHDPRWEREVEGDAAPAVTEQATQVIAVGGVGDHVARVADDGVDGRPACVTVRECSGDGRLPPLVTFFASATTDEKKVVHRGGGDKSPQPRKEQSRGQIPARAEDEQSLCLLVGGVVHEVFAPVHPVNFRSTAP